MSNYRAGRNLEYHVKALFEADGWQSIRGAGSKGEIDGYKVDLVFSKRSSQHESIVYLVLAQMKRRKL
jgi:Holliday junction resolvase